MKAILATLSAAIISSPLAAENFKPGQACIERLHEFVAFKDPTSVKVVGEAKRTGADIVDWKGLRVEAILFDVYVLAKNSYGAYDGVSTLKCATALDGRRVLWIKSP